MLQLPPLAAVDTSTGCISPEPLLHQLLKEGAPPPYDVSILAKLLLLALVNKAQVGAAASRLHPCRVLASRRHPCAVLLAPIGPGLSPVWSRGRPARVSQPPTSPLGLECGPSSQEHPCATAPVAMASLFLQGVPSNALAVLDVAARALDDADAMATVRAQLFALQASAPLHAWGSAIDAACLPRHSRCQPRHGLFLPRHRLCDALPACTCKCLLVAPGWLAACGVWQLIQPVLCLAALLPPAGALRAWQLAPAHGRPAACHLPPNKLDGGD